MQGTQGHDDMARATASVVGKRRKDQGWGWGEEGRGRHRGCIPPPPGSTSCPWLSSFTLAPKIPSLLSCLWP